MGSLGHGPIENFDAFTATVAEESGDAVFGPVLGKGALADRPPEGFDDLTGDLLRRFALGKLDAGDASIEMGVGRLFFDNAVKDLREYRMVPELFHLAVCLAGGHLVDRTEGHVGRGEAAAEQVCDGRK